jgi:CHAT domain-containing protein/Tfp pilus assembly protein PilF
MQVVVVQIESDGLDLIATLHRDDVQIVVADAPHGRDGREWIVLEAEAAGHHRIELSSREHTAKIGHHRIVAKTIAPGDPNLPALRDETRAAQLAADAAHGDAGEASADLWREAYIAYMSAASLHATAADTSGQAHALFAASWIGYWHLWQWLDTADQAASAAQLYLQLGDRKSAANAIHLQAASLIEAANESSDAATAQKLFAKSLNLFNQALKEHNELGNNYDAALVMNNLGLMNYYRGDWSSAREQWQQAVMVMRENGEWYGEFNSLANLGVLEFEKGNLVQAIAVYEKLLALAPEDGELAFRADTLDNLGVSQFTLGRIDSALKSFSEALELHEQLGDVKGKAQSLNGIGVAYYGSGEFDLARKYLEAALPLRRDAQDGRGEAWTLRYLGDIARRDQDYTLAERLHRSALRLVKSPTDRAPVSIALARDLAAIGNFSAAIELLNTERSTLTSAGARKQLSYVLLELAQTRERSGAADAAEGDAEAALALFRDLGEVAGEASALLTMSRIAWRRDSQNLAIDYAERSIQQLERVRGRLIDPELRATFLSTQRNHYEWLASMLMARGRAGDTARALGVSERTRARLTIDLFSEVLGNIVQGVDPKLRADRQRLYERLSELRYQLRNTELDTDGDAERSLASLVDTLHRTETELRVLSAQIRQSSPRYSALTEPPLLNAAQMRSMLDDDTVLLQYLLGEQQSFAWTVAGDEVRGFVLPDRSSIEVTARRLYQLLRQPPSNRERGELEAAVSELSKLLVAPLSQQLKAKRLIVAADGALQYIPFAVLEIADETAGASQLLNRFEIAYVPSVSALAAQTAALEQRAPPTRTLALFADAVFNESDPRLPHGVAIATPKNPNLAPSGRPGANIGSLMRLPGTANEARRIGALVPEDERHFALGFDASRENVMDSQLHQYRIVHFATHGLIDSRFPALSALALSQFDANGRPRNGLLALHEIFDLRLNADLITLSACDTALGKEILGESLLGFTLGFRYAGAREVVATLWQVPDRASTEVMADFYQEFLQDNTTAATALRRAQLIVASQRRWADPFYWAAFVVQ